MMYAVQQRLHTQHTHIYNILYKIRTGRENGAPQEAIRLNSAMKKKKKKGDKKKKKRKAE
jgi:hypothetical protein